MGGGVCRLSEIGRARLQGGGRAGVSDLTGTGEGLPSGKTFWVEDESTKDRGMAQMRECTEVFSGSASPGLQASSARALKGKAAGLILCFSLLG